MSKLNIENKKLKQFPIFPIYGNIQKDEEFYIASIVYPLNLNDDQTIKFENVVPRLYFLSIPTLSNNFQYVNNSVYPYPPTSCGLQFKNDTNLGKIPPFSSTDFILTENLDNISSFSTNSLYSKNVNLKLKNNDIFQNITVNSIYKQGNNIYTDLFSVNSNFKFSSVDLYTSNNLIKGTCNEIFNFVFIPKDFNYTYIQGLIYTGLPMVIYYGSKSKISDGSTYYPMHARYSLTCKSKSQCDNIIPNETQLNDCYNNYINGDVSYICNLNFETSTISSNDIIREKTSNRVIDNNNIDYLNYYIIPKKIYDKNGLSVDGIKIALSFFNFIIGKQSDYVENTSYYTKSIADNGIPKNTNFLFKYCNNEEYLNKNIYGIGCYSCFSISRNQTSGKECQCVINNNIVDSRNEITDTNNFYLPTKSCTSYRNCYCNMPTNYQNSDGLIYCGNSQCSNCKCDDPDITKRCPIEKCSFFLESDQNEEEGLNNKKLTLWIIIGVSSFILILVFIFIIINLRKKDIVYQKQKINIDIV